MFRRRRHRHLKKHYTLDWHTQDDDREIRVALMGKTGAGKSSLGNTLLGKDAFQVHPGMKSGTYDNQVESVHRFGTFLQVTDTPGLCDTHRDEDEVLDEVRSSVLAVYPGPHVILLVLRCDARFTTEEFSAYTSLKKLFGPAVCDQMIVVFNGIDQLEDSPALQRHALAEAVDNFKGNLRHVLREIDYRYYGVNNKASRSSRDQSASDLIAMIENNVAANHGSYLGYRTK